ncbi:unnamed protein product [Lepidochelys kempii]
MTGSSFISVREVFRKTSPACRSSTRTSSGPGNCFQRPGLRRLPWERISSRSSCYTTPSSVCRWQSPTRCASLVLAEVTRVGDLLDYDRGDWLDPLTLAQRMGLSRPHTPRRVLQEVKATLTLAAWAYLNRALRKGAPRPPSTPDPPDLSIGPLARRSQQTPHPFIASWLHELQPGSFQTAPRKHLYTLTLRTVHALTLVSHPDTKWWDLLPPLEGEQPQWASLYSTLIPRPVRDVS